MDQTGNARYSEVARVARLCGRWPRAAKEVRRVQAVREVGMGTLRLMWGEIEWWQHPGQIGRLAYDCAGARVRQVGFSVVEPEER